MALTETQVREARPREKVVRLKDEQGLYLEVTTAGSKYWRLRYWIYSKENRLSLGVYPEVSLYDARVRRDEARRLITNGIDPSAARKAEKAGKLEEYKRQVAEMKAAATSGYVKVTAYLDGKIELWKGKHVLHLDPDEAHQVCGLLSGLLHQGRKPC